MDLCRQVPGRRVLLRTHCSQNHDPIIQAEALDYYCTSVHPQKNNQYSQNTEHEIHRKDLGRAGLGEVKGHCRWSFCAPCKYSVIGLAPKVVKNELFDITLYNESTQKAQLRITCVGRLLGEYGGTTAAIPEAGQEPSQVCQAVPGRAIVSCTETWRRLAPLIYTSARAKAAIKSVITKRRVA